MVLPPVSAIAERRVVAHLRRYGAVTPDKPMGYVPLRFAHKRALARLRRAGVVRGENAALWLDEQAWAQRRTRRRRRALSLATAVAVAGAALALFSTLRG